MNKLSYIQKTLAAVAIMLPVCLYATEPGNDPSNQRPLRPNRMLVVNEIGQFVPFNLEHIADIRFVDIETPAICTVEFTEITHEATRISVAISPEVTDYRMAVVTAEVASHLTHDLDIIAFLQSDEALQLDSEIEDLNLAEIYELKSGGKYVVLTAARDRFGTWDGVSAFEFSVPYPEIVGNPSIDVLGEKINTRMYLVKFSPNSDVSEYYYIFGSVGQTQEKYNSLQADGVYETFEDMVKDLGVYAKGEVRQTFNNLSSNLKYEAIVVLLDVNGTKVPAQTFPMAE